MAEFSFQPRECGPDRPHAAGPKTIKSRAAGVVISATGFRDTMSELAVWTFTECVVRTQASVHTAVALVRLGAAMVQYLSVSCSHRYKFLSNEY